MTPYVKAGAAVLGLAAVCGAGYAIYNSSITDRSASVAAMPVGVAGMKAHVDPQTGALIKAPIVPETQALTPQEQIGASTSGAGLVEQQAAGGGVVLDLQGRFQSPLVATIGPGGKMTMDHVHDVPLSTQAK